MTQGSEKPGDLPKRITSSAQYVPPADGRRPVYAGGRPSREGVDPRFQKLDVSRICSPDLPQKVGAFLLWGTFECGVSSEE